MTETDERTKVAEKIKGIRIAMLTTVDPDGRLVAHPMSTQEVEFDGTVWFIAERSSGQARSIEVRPQVNVAYVSDSTWVSLSGTAAIVSDVAKLNELWSTFTDPWMEGGPENPNNILIRIDVDTAWYWDGPGSKVTNLVNLIRTAVTGKQVEGDSGTVQM